MAIHGHTIMELHDVKSGETQVLEKDNVVTGAVAEILTPLGAYTSANGLFNSTAGDMDNFITRFFGGLLLYDTALGASPDTLFAPATAHLTGCAGYKLRAPGLNPLRGDSNLIESDLDLAHGTAKFVYDFGTAQANGTIAAICLSDRFAGYTGAERAAAAQVNELMMSGCDYAGGVLSDAFLPQLHYIDSTEGTLYEVNEQTDRTLHARLGISGTAAKVTIKRYAALLHSVSLFWPRNGTLPPVVEQQAVDLTGQLQTNTLSYFAMNYDAQRRRLYLVSTPGSKTEANAADWVFEIDPDTGKYTKYTVPNQTGVALSGQFNCQVANIGAYVYDGVLYRRSYAQQDSAYRLFAIPLADPAAVAEIAHNGNNMQRVDYACAGRIYGSGYSGSVVLNTAGRAVYSLPINCNYYQDNLVVVPICGRSVLCLSNAGDVNSTIPYGGRIGIKHNYLATINDLPTPVVKTADKTMKITYILRDGG